MKKIIIILLIYTNSNYAFSQCTQISELHTTNISYNNALANWGPLSNIDHYKIHYKIYGTSTWANLGNIGGLDSVRNLPLLEENTKYEWEIKSFCDSTNQMASSWSSTDTFTTSTFIASDFNPNIINSVDNIICNTQTSLTLYTSQSINEPDIGTSRITTDGGNFNIQSLSIGDSVGYVIMILATQTILATLRVGLIAEENYAIINSYDNSGNVIGFFSIENTNEGIEVNSTSPNDGNNYTSGYISEVKFNNLFINPNINGPLNFYTDIKSELNDQFNDTSTVIINCISTNIENNKETNLSFEIYDLLGRKTKFKEDIVLIYRYSNGEIRKKISIKK